MNVKKKKKKRIRSIKTHSQIIILSKKKYSIKKIAQKRSFRSDVYHKNLKYKNILFIDKKN